MMQMYKPENDPDLGNLSVRDVLEAIGSPLPSSGAGISAAVALALATACALKAVNVSLKHKADPELQRQGERLKAQRERAMDRARVDARLFGKYLQDHEPRDAAMLVEAAADFQLLAKEIAVELEGLDAKVSSTVVADVTAAQTLHAAAVTIEGFIMHGSRKLRARTMP